MPRKSPAFAAVREIALALPEVVDASSARGVAFKVHGRLLACTAIHSSAEEGTLAVPIDAHLRASLLAAEPDVYYLTPHYEPYPMVLVRLARIRRTELRKLLETAWLFVTSNPRKRRQRAAGKAPRRKSATRGSGARKREA
jgi:hypothetical protein